MKKDLGAGAVIYTLMIPAGAFISYAFGASLLGIVGIILVAIGIVMLGYRIFA